jgi:hypothetical protein
MKEGLGCNVQGLAKHDDVGSDFGRGVKLEVVGRDFVNEQFVLDSEREYRRAGGVSGWARGSGKSGGER